MYHCHIGDQTYNTGTVGRHTIQAREKYLGEDDEFGSGWEVMAPGPSHPPQGGCFELASYIRLHADKEASSSWDSRCRNRNRHGARGKPRER